MGRILIATDGSDAAIDAAAHATTLLGSNQDYTVVTVVSTVAGLYGLGATVGVEPLAAPAADPEITQAQIEAQRHESDEAVDRTLAAIGVAARREVVQGEPGRELCRVAAEGGYDLLVVGSHGAGLVRRVLVGSVSHYVLHHAVTPVLVVRRPDEE